MAEQAIAGARWAGRIFFRLDFSAPVADLAASVHGILVTGGAETEALVLVRSQTDHLLGPEARIGCPVAVHARGEGLFLVGEIQLLEPRQVLRGVPGSGLHHGGQDRVAVVALPMYELALHQLEVGVKQGCVLSPLVFALYIRRMGVRLIQSGLGAKVGKVVIPGMFFADDMVIFGESREEFLEMLAIVSEEWDRLKLEFNVKKSKVMLSGSRNKGQVWELGGIKSLGATGN